MPNECFYDEVSDQGFISVPKSDDSESGIMVFKLTYFDVYLPQTMSNHATDINEKAQMANFSVLAKGRRPRQELFAKKPGKLKLNDISFSSLQPLKRSEQISLLLKKSLLKHFHQILYGKDHFSLCLTLF